MSTTRDRPVDTAEIVNSMNRLAGEKSPYLLQHASNPVDWYPWGEEAFTRARDEDKPVFLSIGYSTCHWCHVMAHESFENADMAALLNSTFVCIKVDREERPDIDAVYMAVCQAMTGSGGWPMSIFMTADKVPFFAATYIPPRTRHGRVGLVDLVPRISQLWETNRSALAEAGAQVVDAVSRKDLASSKGSDSAVFEEGFWELSRRFDERYAGFGGAPKFPTPHTLMFLLRHWKRTGNARALEMVERTLTAMRRGGIYDHVGFGFHRYSTDDRWLLPHFEKMLYDQAMLGMAYTEAFLATGTPFFAVTSREINEYVLRDLLLPEAAFASAEDADSEGEEGLFYVWTEDELRAVLPPDDARLVMETFSVRRVGNFTAEGGGPGARRNILHQARPLPEIARALEVPLEEATNRIDAARGMLLAARNLRVRPGRDDKILADWNGLMIAALAKAASALDEPRYLAAARRAADFVLSAMRTSDGSLLHRYREGDAAIPGFADDYAFLAWGLLELYEASFHSAHLLAAVELTDRLLDDFADAQGGLFLTARDAEPMLIRPQEVYDGAIPSANSVAVSNLVRLNRITGEARYEEHARRLSAAFAAHVRRAPSAHAQFLIGLDHLLNPSREIVIAGNPDFDDARALLTTIRSRFLPATTVILNRIDPSDRLLLRIAPALADKLPINGHATAYLCRAQTCLPPITDASELAALLDSPAGCL